MATSTREVRGLTAARQHAAASQEMVSSRGGLVRSALFQAVKLVRDQARLKAPRDTGALAKNIVAVRDSDPRANGASERYIVGVRKITKSKLHKARKAAAGTGKRPDYKSIGDTYYWRFVEFGTRFVKARPFLRPAFESEKYEAVTTFTDSLARGIQRVVAKMPK